MSNNLSGTLEKISLLKSIDSVLELKGTSVSKLFGGQSKSILDILTETLSTGKISDSASYANFTDAIKAVIDFHDIRSKVNFGSGLKKDLMAAPFIVEDIFGKAPDKLKKMYHLGESSGTGQQAWKYITNVFMKDISTKITSATSSNASNNSSAADEASLKALKKYLRLLMCKWTLRVAGAVLEERLTENWQDINLNASSSTKLHSLLYSDIGDQIAKNKEIASLLGDNSASIVESFKTYRAAYTVLAALNKDSDSSDNRSNVAGMYGMFNLWLDAAGLSKTVNESSLDAVYSTIAKIDAKITNAVSDSTGVYYTNAEPGREEDSHKSPSKTTIKGHNGQTYTANEVFSHYLNSGLSQGLPFFKDAIGGLDESESPGYNDKGQVIFNNDIVGLLVKKDNALKGMFTQFSNVMEFLQIGADDKKTNGGNESQLTTESWNVAKTDFKTRFRDLLREFKKQHSDCFFSDKIENGLGIALCASALDDDDISFKRYHIINVTIAGTKGMANQKAINWHSIDLQDPESPNYYFAQTDNSNGRATNMASKVSDPDEEHEPNESRS